MIHRFIPCVYRIHVLLRPRMNHRTFSVVKIENSSRRGIRRRVDVVQVIASGASCEKAGVVVRCSFLTGAIYYPRRFINYPFHWGSEATIKGSPLIDPFSGVYPRGIRRKLFTFRSVRISYFIILFRYGARIIR